MKTLRIGMMAALGMFIAACSSQKVSSKNDTYLTAKQRAEINKSQQKDKPSEGIDSRDDNFSRSSRDYEDDYCYSCRVRRYSTGVWYDPWWGPGWGWSSWYGPGWGWSWRSWYGPGWSWSYYSAWDPYWGWGPAYAGPGWYYSPAWGWTYYAGPGWWTNPSPNGSSYSPRYNYRPRTYTTPTGNTTYRPPRGTIVTPGGNPPRRSAAPASPTPSRPYYAPSTPRNPSGAGRPSIQSGSTGGGTIRSSSPNSTTRPR